MAVESITKDSKYYINDIALSLHRELTSDQYSALKQILDKIIRIPSPKIIDLNIPFWLIKRFYLQVYFGIDKRTSKRNKQDKANLQKMKQFKERNAEYYLSCLPENIIKSFNYEEKRIIEATLNRAIAIPSKKIIESNLTFKLKKKYYLAVYLGFDRRKGRRSNPDSLMDKLSFIGSALIYLFVILIVLYFAKTVLNYDIIPGRHFLDVLIEKLGLNY